MILIFGDIRDPHIQTVRKHIIAKGGKVEVFSRYDALCRITISCLDTFEIFFSIGDKIIKNYEVTSVWWRQKPFRLFHPDKPERNAAEEFIGREWKHLLYSLSTFLPSAFWINKIENQNKANYKPNQLLWATKAGFNIPKTFFSNDIYSIEKLFELSPKVIYKTYSGYVFPEAKAIFTSEINQSFLKENSNSLGIAPGIYQTYIDKEFELRVTFVGSDLFAAKINSQSRNDTLIDWRENQEVNIYSVFDLPLTIKEKLRNFICYSDLTFGTIDLIVDKKGNYIFLECNPAGQWLWIEDFINLPISSSVAENLLNLKV
jgi:glutathione synthase/RimK-type ligase-like ATP-grasp enzyme